MAIYFTNDITDAPLPQGNMRTDHLMKLTVKNFKKKKHSKNELCVKETSKYLNLQIYLKRMLIINHTTLLGLRTK